MGRLWDRLWKSRRAGKGRSALSAPTVRAGGALGGVGLSRSLDATFATETRQARFGTATVESSDRTYDARGRLTVLGQARYVWDNHADFAGMLITDRNYVVGTGPKHRFEVRGYGEDVGALLTDDFHWWKRRVHFRSMLSLLRLIYSRDGEVFCLLLDGEADPETGVRLDWQLLESEQCRTPRAMERDRDVRQGVRLDAGTRRPTAYYFVTVEEGTGRETVTEYPASQVIHLFARERANQVRGISAARRVVDTAEQQRDVDGSVSNSMALSAKVQGTIETPMPEADFVGGGDEGDAGGGELLAIRPGDRTTRVGPGEILALHHGASMKTVMPTQPAAGYPEWRKSTLSTMGHVYQLPHVLAGLDSSNANFSASRLDINSHGRACEVDQADLDEFVCDRFIDAYCGQWFPLRTGLAYAARRVSYTSTWPTPPTPDPLKSVQAAKLEKEMGWLSDEEYWRRQGRDPVQMRASIEAERKRWPTVSGGMDGEVGLSRGFFKFPPSPSAAVDAEEGARRSACRVPPSAAVGTVEGGGRPQGRVPPSAAVDAEEGTRRSEGRVPPSAAVDAEEGAGRPACRVPPSAAVDAGEGAGRSACRVPPSAAVDAGEGARRPEDGSAFALGGHGAGWDVDLGRKGFDPNQPRDEDGRWSDTGGGGTGSGRTPTPKAQASATTSKPHASAEAQAHAKASAQAAQAEAAAMEGEARARRHTRSAARGVAVETPEARARREARGQALQAWGARHLAGSVEALDASSREALKDYTDNSICDAFNRVLSGRAGDMPEAERAMYRRMADSMAEGLSTCRLRKRLRVYRCSSPRDFGGYDKIRVGGDVDQRGRFTSTSLDRGVAFRFASNRLREAPDKPVVLMRIDAQRGSEGGYLGTVGHKPKQTEVLFNRDTTEIVVSRVRRFGMVTLVDAKLSRKKNKR